MQLRSYQREAIDSIYKYWERNDGNPLVVLPTGTGKSLVCGTLVDEIMQQWQGTKILVAAHVRELVEQNYIEYVTISPFADAGIYSAGLNRKDTRNATVFCSIQSVYDNAYRFKHVDLLFVDEAHTIPKEGDGMWVKFIAALKEINPKLKIVGFTATDYRMDSGLLTSGEGAIFSDVCYEYPILQAFKDGFLCPIVPTTMATKYDIENLRSSSKDYTEEALDSAFNIDEKTLSALDEVEAYGADRKSWLIFSAGNKHAEKIHAELTRRGYKGACVTDKSTKEERRKAVAGIKSGEIRYIVNNKIFTTGFNAKNIDMIVDFGKTKSQGLHVQKLGRGTRCIGADIFESIENGKANCLLLDFARNVDYHGPLDQIRGFNKNKGEGEAPIKVCPGKMPSGDDCHEVLFAGIRKCFKCGHEFDFGSELDIRTNGGDNAVISTQQEPEWYQVIDVVYFKHKKDGKPNPTMRVKYITIGKAVQEWVCFDHEKGSFAHNKARMWHNKTGATFEMPGSVDDALLKPYPKPKRILVAYEGKYARVLDHDYSGEVEIIPEENKINWGDFEIPY